MVDAAEWKNNCVSSQIDVEQVWSTMFIKCDSMAVVCGPMDIPLLPKKLYNCKRYQNQLNTDRTL